MPTSPSFPEPDTGKKIGLKTATTLVIANMVGTGVFTSLGFQAAGINHPLPLLLLWIVGGLIALCGGFSYAELGSALPRSGGEYHYLSRLYHPMAGFLSGWVSATIGFSAPIALAGMAFGQYFYGALPLLSPHILASVVIIGVTIVHLVEIRIGGRFQFSVTVVELCLIGLFIVCGVFVTPKPVALNLIPTPQNLSFLFTPGLCGLADLRFICLFGMELLYLPGRRDQEPVQKYTAVDPYRHRHRHCALCAAQLYIHADHPAQPPFRPAAGRAAVRRQYLRPGRRQVHGRLHRPVPDIHHQLHGHRRAPDTEGHGRGLPASAFFSRPNSRNVPWIAIVTQSGIALVLLWTSTFEKVLTFAGFTLALVTCFSVIGVFILRAKKINAPGSYKTTGFPVTPVIFLLLNLWMLVFLLKDRPVESFAGLGILALGAAVYYIIKRSPSK